MKNFQNAFIQIYEMEHLLNGHLLEIRHMFKDVLVPVVNSQSSETQNDVSIFVDYYEPGIFVFSIEGENLFQYLISDNEEKFFKPMETFLFVLYQNAINVKIDETTSNCDYRILFKMNK